MAAIVLPAIVATAGVGVLAAVLLGTHRAIQPVLILLALGSYFASGGFVPVSGLPPLARAVNTWWPPSYVFEWANPLLHGFTSRPSAAVVAAAVVAAALAVILAAVATQRANRRKVTHGQ
ncbi:hypothetical protein UQW22_02670 [Isoptericola halotolerans]|uniref:hypothetical protein n=1 Tax=Isoptericola halotolerans TaxID=300560 RepID=UPI003890EF53